MMLTQYCQQFGWTAADLARNARLDYKTAMKAMRGLEVSGRTAQAVAAAISASLGQEVNVGQISGLRVKVYRSVSNL